VRWRGPSIEDDGNVTSRPEESHLHIHPVLLLLFFFKFVVVVVIWV